MNRAVGTAASATVLILWPVVLRPQRETPRPLGGFTAQLAPNMGASPAGTYCVAVLQLDDGTVRTEYWAVRATSPMTIAAALTTPGTGLGNLAATQFAVPRALPAPAGVNDARNRGYGEAAVANVGAGSFVSKAGDTMTAP